MPFEINFSTSTRRHFCFQSILHTKNEKKEWFISENFADEHQHYEKSIIKCDCIPVKQNKEQIKIKLCIRNLRHNLLLIILQFVIYYLHFNVNVELTQLFYVEYQEISLYFIRKRLRQEMHFFSGMNNTVHTQKLIFLKKCVFSVFMILKISYLK